MNLGESLRKLIKDNINSTRPFFGYVIEQNADKTWVVQPVDDQPVVNNVQTFQTELDGNDPIIGSLVLCIFIDDYNSFITEIIEYNTWFVNAETSSTMYSANNTVLAGKRLILLGEEKTVEEVKNTVDSIENNGDTGILLESKNIRLQSADGNDGLITIKCDGDLFVLSKNSIEINGDKSTEIISNFISLNLMLRDIVATLNTLVGAAGNVVPPLPLVPNLVIAEAQYNQNN